MINSRIKYADSKVQNKSVISTNKPLIHIVSLLTVSQTYNISFFVKHVRVCVLIFDLICSIHVTLNWLTLPVYE